jgi:hypothetical protein
MQRLFGYATQMTHTTKNAWPRGCKWIGLAMLIAVSMLCACVSSLKGRAVLDATFDVVDSSFQEVRAVKAYGQEYGIKGRALYPLSSDETNPTAKPRWRDVGLPDEIDVAADTDFFTVHRDEGGSFRLVTLENPFAFKGPGPYWIKVTFFSTPPIEVVREYPVDPGFPLPSFKGEDASLFGEMHGGSGKNVLFEASEYDGRGTGWEAYGRLVLLREVHGDRWFIIPASGGILIDARGGAGRMGETGSNVYLKQGETGPVYGEPGGPGGNGGNGGHIVVRIARGSVIPGDIRFNVDGGPGGPGGIGGSGDANTEPTLLEAIFGRYRGPNGPNGYPGASGSLRFEYVNTVDDLFLGPAPVGFDRSRVSP